MKLFKTDHRATFLTEGNVSKGLEIYGKSYSNSKTKSSKQFQSQQRLSLKKSGNFSRSTRRDLFTIPKTPGPGQYEILNLTLGPSYSLIGKSRVSACRTPGPGTYSPNLIENKKKGCKIGKAQRLDSSQILETPGPGQYEKKIRPSTPCWSFYKDKEKLYFNPTPGPGKYESRTLSKGIEHKTPVSNRKELFIATDTPGPGAYNLESSRQNSARNNFFNKNMKKDHKGKVRGCDYESISDRLRRTYIDK